jgi:LPXTG-motif cell wall-anchored protein
MNCAVNSTKMQQDDGTMRGIEIIPEGCQPVSESECSSGYMAPAENVTFPVNSLKQCCKCKMGEACPLCTNPSACTEEEKEQFVTDSACFGNAAPGPGPSQPETGFTTSYIVIGLVGLLLLILIGMFLFSRRPKTIGPP